MPQKLLKQYALLPGAERVTGVPRSTIKSAIERGEIKAYSLADDTLVVNVNEVRDWRKRADERPVGRPAQK